MRELLFFLMLCLGLTSCKRVFFDEEPGVSNADIFDQVWNYTNEKYSFFEFKNINWDSVKTVYSSKITNEIGEDSLFNVLSDMLYVLRDGHVNLISSFDVSRNWNWYLDYPSNYSENMLERHYFKDKQQLMGPFTVFDFGDVGYVHYSSFSSTVTGKKMEQLLTKFKNHKGLIIDVRDNGGGAISNVYNIGNYFVSEPTLVAYQRVKKGIDKNDFTEYGGVQFNPPENFSTYLKPVVILTNRKCYSATNIFTTMMGALPKVTVVGDKTGGGGGVPTYTQLSNGWSLRVSSSQMLSLDLINNEDGVLPDRKVDISIADENNSIDSILEDALAFLRQ
ncbi:MAG: hypothetical protein ACJA0Q_001329 [Saprospiraceae bacterium]|jgi:hypothetical protein